LTLRWFDDAGNVIFFVKNNVLRFATTVWDMQHVGNRLKLHAGARDTYLEIKFDTENGVVSLERGRLARNGIEIFLRPDFFYCPNVPVLMSKCVLAQRHAVGIKLGDDPDGKEKAVYWSGPGIQRDRRFNRTSEIRRAAKSVRAINTR
jgi:hypothetical protein